MSKPTIHILFKLIDAPWGGGNQFLKSLKRQFCRMGVYEDDSEKADIILFNSNPGNYQDNLLRCYHLRKNLRKTIINRVAGPTFIARGFDLLVDKAIYYFDSRFCDGTIFQSGCSRQQNLRLGMKAKKHETIIINAPDPEIFYPGRVRTAKDDNLKIKLIATSWSPNMRKGFDIYKFLDENLDFSKYEMSFYGNSPVAFKNIKYFKPVTTAELAEKLRENDIFITASVYEACSNSLLEALHSGLPAVVRTCSSDFEIAGAAGAGFKDERDVIDAIGNVAKNLDEFRKNIKPPDLFEVSLKYYDFCKETHSQASGRRKHVGYADLLWMKTLLRMADYARKRRIGRT